jgi:hypothetical protein
MCIDFANLNKACPKDDYPLPLKHASIHSDEALVKFVNAITSED